MNSYDRQRRLREEVYIRGTGAPLHREIVVSEPAWVRSLLWTSFPLLGGGVGWSIKALAGWVASLPWAPLQGPFELAHRLVLTFGEPQATIGALGLGAVAGLALAFVAEHENLTVVVSHDRVATKRGESSQEIARSHVGCVFADENHFVLLGRDTEELLHEPSDLDPDELRTAFVVFGYPWLGGGDPFKNDYRLWVEGTTDLPPAADALFGARARALERDDGEADATVLRAELARLGIVIRDENKRQYWRRAGEGRPV